MFQESFKSISHLVIAISSILLVVVAFWRDDLTVVVRLGASVLDQHDWQGHLSLALLLANILEGSVATLTHQVVRLVVVSIVHRSGCQTALR